MAEIEFKTKERRKGRIVTAIHAQTDSGWNMSLYLDNDTGDVQYPVTVEPVIPSMTITLESGNAASCSLPPSIPDSMVDGFIRYLETFHDIVAAAHQLIKKEQQAFVNSE